LKLRNASLPSVIFNVQSISTALSVCPGVTHLRLSIESDGEKFMKRSRQEIKKR